MLHDMKRYIYLFLVPSVSLLGCTNGTRMTDTFSQVEAIMSSIPDSALQLLRDVPAESLNNRSERARYALLYAEAADRTGITGPGDSLLSQAYDYYLEQPHATRNLCRVLYFQGQSKLRQGDKPGGLRLFLEVEQQLLLIDEFRYLGLLYLRIGELYHAELNFIRAYRYFKEARNLFLRSDDTLRMAEASLGMAAAALRMNDMERARCDCTLALELADEAHDERLIRRSLSYFATLYAVSDTIRIPEELLRRIEQTLRRDTTAAGLCTLAQTQLLRNCPDSALRHIEAAERATTRVEELPVLLYTAYKANVLAGDYKEATRNIHRFISLTDSLTRAALLSSAGMIEREYFRERAAFDDYRLRNRRVWELATAGGVFLLFGIATYIVQQRMRLHKERNERYLLLVREMQAEYRELFERMEQTYHAEARLKGVIASRFDIVDRLGRTLYERDDTASGQAAMTRQVKRLINDFSENGEMLRELEQIVDMAHDDAMLKLRHDFPKMKEADVRLLCYIFGGFSPQVISLFMHDSVANIYARKSRLKSRIRASESLNRELFTSLLG